MSGSEYGIRCLFDLLFSDPGLNFFTDSRILNPYFREISKKMFGLKILKFFVTWLKFFSVPVQNKLICNIFWIYSSKKGNTTNSPPPLFSCRFQIRNPRSGSRIRDWDPGSETVIPDRKNSGSGFPRDKQIGSATLLPCICYLSASVCPPPCRDGRGGARPDIDGSSLLATAVPHYTNKKWNVPVLYGEKKVWQVWQNICALENKNPSSDPSPHDIC